MTASLPVGTPRVAVLGAGVSGILMAIKLLKAGIRTFVVFERADAVGGTWQQHTYPGLCCDVPSHVYSYSFALNPDWSRIFPEQAELRDYFHRCAHEFGVLPFVRLSTPVAAARFDEADGTWTIELANGEKATFDFVISALGFLNKPELPDIPGRESFRGPSWHSAHWDGTVDLANKRVVVVGSAASAVQIVPEVAKVAAHVSVFQRTPNWIVPRRNMPYTEAQKERFRKFPALMRLHRWLLYLYSHQLLAGFLGNRRILDRMRAEALAHMHAHIHDPAMRKALTPSFEPGCKRMLVTDDFYPALLRSNVELITAGIERIDEDAVVTREGRRVPADVIIFCTGYKMPNYAGPVPVEGRDGKTLAAHMDRFPEAYRGVAVPGFPNFFMINGPNGPLGYTSVIMPAEIQTSYIIRMIKRSRDRGLRWIDVKESVSRRYNDQIQAKLRKSSLGGDCLSYYHDTQGRVWTFYPGSAHRMWWEFRHCGLSDYIQVA